MYLNDTLTFSAITFSGYLSPQSAQESQNLESVHHYTMQEIEAGEAGNGTVYHKIMQVTEKTSDILIAGGDPFFIRKMGIDCDYQWMLQNPKRELLCLLDTSNCLRTDCRSLAEALKIDYATVESECSSGGKSCTETVIKHWCETTGKRMTLRRLHEVLTHPGLVGNKTAAEIIENMLSAVGCQVKYIRVGVIINTIIRAALIPFTTITIIIIIGIVIISAIISNNSICVNRNKNIFIIII